MREHCAGIGALRKEYTPQPYNRTDKRGNRVALESRAETAAKHLAEEQWGKTQEVKEQRVRHESKRYKNKEQRRGTEKWKNVEPIVTEDTPGYKKCRPDPLSVCEFHEIERK